MNRDLIQRIGTKLILPFVLLFALYVQFHGEVGPGGGFQAGAIAAGVIILVSITFGLEMAKRIAPDAMVHRMIPLGILLFTGTGVAGLIGGHNFLDYVVLHEHPVYARVVGIVLVELGVLITVCGTLIGLFYAFVERGR